MPQPTLEGNDDMHFGYSRYQTSHGRAKRLLGFVALALVLATLAVTTNAPMVSARSVGSGYFINNFSCGNLSTNHCYALERWGTTYGSFTIETVVNLSCTCNTWYDGETGFINNEMWVAQFGNSGCKDSGNTCWVEGGYSDSGGIGGTLHYFWADSRPGGGYNGHDLNGVPSGDLNGSLLLYFKQINSATWDV